MSVEKLGIIPSKPGLMLASVLAGGKVIYGNGHGPNMVTDGRYWFPAGLKPAWNGPVVKAVTGGNLFGEWKIAFAYYSSQRVATSNLSPFSESIDFGTATNGAIEISFPDGILPHNAAGTLVDQFSNSADRIQIWAKKIGDELVRIGEMTFARIARGYFFLFHDINAQYEAYKGFADRVATVTGQFDQPVSIGNDPIPAGKFFAFGFGRLWILGSENFTHAGTIKILSWDEAVARGYTAPPGRKRALVLLNPIQPSAELFNGNTEEWQQGLWWPFGAANASREWVWTLQNQIRVLQGRKGIIIANMGRIIARITKEGAVYLRGTLMPNPIGAATTIDNNMVWNADFSIASLTCHAAPWKSWRKVNTKFADPPEGWAISSGTCLHTVGQTSGMEQSLAWSGIRSDGTKEYVLRYLVAGRTQGNITAYIGAVAGATVDYNGLIEGTITPAAGFTALSFVVDGAGDFDGSITDIEVFPMPVVQTASIENFVYGEDVVININVNVGTDAVPSWETGVFFDSSGNLWFDRETTIYTTPDYSVLTDNAFSLADDPIHWDHVPPSSSRIAFVPYKFTYGGTTQIRAVSDYTVLNIGGRTSCSFRVLEIIENASEEDLMGGAWFQDGLRYKSLYVTTATGRKLISTVWDVVNRSELWLNHDVEDADTDYHNWELVGDAAVKYSNYGDPEVGRYVDSLTQEGVGNFLWAEFNPGAGWVPTGLSMGPDGLEVSFDGQEFLVRAWGTGQSLDEGEYSIERRLSGSATLAARSIVRDRHDSRISLVGNPIGIGLTRGHETEIVTDRIFGRRALTEVAEILSLRDACGAWFTTKDGDHYLLANMSSLESPGGRDYSLLIDFRGPEIHMTRLHQKQFAALTTILTNDGTHRLAYLDRSGNIGYAFNDVTDFGDPQFCEQAFFVAPTKLGSLFSLMALRPIASCERDTFTITADVYLVPGTVEPEQLEGYLGPGGQGYPWYRFDFTQDDCRGQAFMAGIRPITAEALVIVVSWVSDVEITFKGLDVHLNVIGEPVRT